MLTINTIIEEIKDVPVNRLEEIYEFIHSMTPATKITENSRRKILSFGGAFGDMSSEDYADFPDHTKKVITQFKSYHPFRVPDYQSGYFSRIISALRACQRTKAPQG